MKKNSSWNVDEVRSVKVDVDGDSENKILIDYRRLLDSSTDVRRSYDWLLVMVTPESEVYDIDFIKYEDPVPPSNDDDKIATWAIGVIILSIICCCFLCFLVFRESRKRKLSKHVDDTSDIHMDGALEVPVIPEEEEMEDTQIEESIAADV